MAVMLDAGLPILKTLQVLTNKVESTRLRRVVNTLAYDVEHGRKLSDAMSKFPDVFDESEIGVVRSGESIGNLNQVLFKLANQHESLYGLGLTVLCALGVAMWVVLTFVIAKLEEFFIESEMALPKLTLVVLALSRFTASFWWLILIVLLLFFALWSLYVNTRMGRLRWDRFKLNMPVFGDVIKKSLLSRIIRMLGVLTHAGLPINKTLSILADASGNTLYKIKLGGVKEAVERGEKISDTLADTPFLFPETVTQMLQVGEQSASISQTAEKVADHYEMEVDHAVRNMTTVLEPLIIIVVGIAVAVVALAILGPIFSLSDLV